MMHEEHEHTTILDPTLTSGPTHIEIRGIKPPEPDDELFSIWNIDNKEQLVTIDRAGRLTYGPNYTPEAAAAVFWETIARMIPPALIVKP
jgi:hypothetical protein